MFNSRDEELTIIANAAFERCSHDLTKMRLTDAERDRVLEFVVVRLGLFAKALSKVQNPTAEDP